jgi:hypothetical protein
MAVQYTNTITQVTDLNSLVKFVPYKWKVENVEKQEITKGKKSNKITHECKR